MKRFSATIADFLSPYDKYLDSAIAPKNGNLYDSLMSKIYASPDAFSRYSGWKEIVHPKL